jgi:hypothetical protein
VLTKLQVEDEVIDHIYDGEYVEKAKPQQPNFEAFRESNKYV